MRLIESHNLRVEEAILTGESTVVDKTTDALEGELPLGDRTNMSSPAPPSAPAAALAW
jgi:magnesium-transporting ATPase (P-type)